MGYVKHIWETGEWLSADGMNHIEEGIEDLQQVKADKEEVGAVITAVDRNAQDIISLQNSLGDVLETAEATAEVVATKADQTDLDMLRDGVATKAEANELLAVASATDRLLKEIDTAKTELSALKDQVAVKADSSDLAGAIADAAILEENTRHWIEEVENKSETAGVHVELDRLQRMDAKLEQSIGVANSAISNITYDIGNRVSKPVGSPDGVAGQMLASNGDGTTTWVNPAKPTDQQIGSAVSDWLDEHPEATTTVEDGTITMDKLSQDVQEAIESSGDGSDADAQTLLDAHNLLLDRLIMENDDIRHHLETYLSYEGKLRSYAELFANGSGTGFLFFTDPHNMSSLFGETHEDMLKDLRYIRYVFENTPASYVLCGGDWLNVEHTLEEALLIGGRIPNLLRTEIGEACYTAPGNHDTNEESGARYGRLTETALARLWYGRDTGYFKIEGADCDCYMLHVGYSLSAVNAYQQSEAAWFAGELLANTKPHLFAVGHIIGGTDGALFGDVLCGIMDAFNQRISVTINGTTYDYRDATGTFHFCMSGHYHRDTDDVINHIPVIYTDNFSDGKAIDCCYADFSRAKLRLIRVGEGADREFAIIPNNGYIID